LGTPLAASVNRTQTTITGQAPEVRGRDPEVLRERRKRLEWIPRDAGPLGPGDRLKDALDGTFHCGFNEFRERLFDGHGAVPYGP
jgi:hypothetical protein